MTGQLCFNWHLQALLVGAFLSISAPSLAETIVVTDSRYPVTAGPDVRVIVLDRAKDIQRQMSQGLPADPNLAKAEFQRRYGGQRGASVLQEMRVAQQGVVDAWTLKIAKVPAVVVDRRFVVYGYTDVAHAEAVIAAHRKQVEVGQ